MRTRANLYPGHIVHSRLFSENFEGFEGKLGFYSKKFKNNF